MQHLNLNTLLKGGEYRIEKVLGQGGFGITYLAEQVNLKRKVAIKEFFIKELCNRDETQTKVSVGSLGSVETVERFKKKFLKEARNIAGLDHPNIVRIFDVFEENDTVYYVMEYLEGGSLGDLVKAKGAQPEAVALRYIRQIAEALSYMHDKKISHLDIKPGNIMLNKKDEAVLIDFGLSKQYDAETGNQTSTISTIGVSEGYSPIEQTQAGGISEFSPQTDIYALGATLYKLVTGFTPPNASEVLNDGLPSLPSNVSKPTAEAIKKAMQPSKGNRPQNIEDFVYLLPKTGGGGTGEDGNKEKNKGLLAKFKRHSKEVLLCLISLILLGRLGWRYQDFIAAYLGDVEEQYSLGFYYANGYGGTEDYDEAAKWWQKAAEQGYSSAQNQLGDCYAEGKGVPQDLTEAAKWYRKAAEQGSAEALKKLEEMRETPTPTTKIKTKETSQELVPPGYYRGSIGDDNTAKLYINVQTGGGTYTYDNGNMERTLKIVSYDAGQVEIHAYSKKTGEFLGQLVGTLTEQFLKGKFTNNKGVQVDFDLSRM